MCVCMLVCVYVGVCVCVCRELIGSHPANFATVMRGVINNELGQYRSPSNMALLSMMVHSWPDEAAKVRQELVGVAC